MPAFLSSAAQLMCTHGGTVSISSTDSRVSVIDGPVVRTTDLFIVGGCPFTLPPAVYHPCVTLQWSVTCDRTSAISLNCLNESSVAECQAADQAVQGVAKIVNTQQQAAGD